MLLSESLPEASWLGIDDEINVTLPMQRYVLTAMPRDDWKPETLEQRSQQCRVGRCVFDEFESVRAHGILDVRDLRGSGVCMSTHNSPRVSQARLHTSHARMSIGLQWMVTIETIRAQAVNKDPT